MPSSRFKVNAPCYQGLQEIDPWLSSHKGHLRLFAYGIEGWCQQNRITQCTWSDNKGPQSAEPPSLSVPLTSLVKASIKACLSRVRWQDPCFCW